jgi:hypothetical protein
MYQPLGHGTKERAIGSAASRVKSTSSGATVLIGKMSYSSFRYLRGKGGGGEFKKGTGEKKAGGPTT